MYLKGSGYSRALRAGAAILGLLLSGIAQALMQPLSDGELSDVEGQSLFSINYIPAPTSSSPPAGANNNQGISFYRLDMNTQVNFNANIAQFQLGCGGVNNVVASGCDVDISNLRFMGNNGAGGPGSAVTSDFQLGNPFITLAIKNDGTPQAQVVGFQIGALNALGYLGFGNPDSVDGSGNPVAGGGINKFSGYMGAQTTGQIRTVVCWFGSANAGRTGCSSGIPSAIEGTVNQTTIVAGQRLGQFTATGSNALKINASGINIYADLTEALGFMHGISVNASGNLGQPTPDFSTSFQSQAINWQQLSTGTFPGNGAQTAQPGWWMSIPNVSVVLQNPTTYISGGEAFGGLFGVHVPINNVLLGQTPPKNCYGTANFC